MNKKYRPSDQEILDQLTKILQSDEFHRSSRISSFLEFIVHKTLKDKTDELKGYIIGIEVFEKSEDFDPGTDSSVRVEATRLRKALTLYYNGLGQNDNVIIKVPKGSYKPIFCYNDNEGTSEVENKNSHHLKTAAFNIKNPIYYIPTLLFICVLFLSITLFIQSKNQYRPKSSLLPVVVLLPLKGIGDNAASEIADNLTRRIAHNLSLFRSLETLNTHMNTRTLDGLKTSAEIGKKLKADYVLVGSVKKNINNVTIVVRLLDIKNTTYIWSFNQEYDMNLERNKWMDNAAGTIVSQIASPYAVIQNNEPQRIGNTALEKNTDYQCILDYYAYSNSKNPQSHKNVRTCLEEIIQHNPENSDAWAYLSWIYGDEFRFSYNKKGSEKDIKERSLNAAQKAVETDPQNPRSHQYMANAAHLNDDIEKTIEHLKISVELNPYDSEILADAAWNYGQLGDWDKSSKLGLRAIEINPRHAGWYHGVLFAYFYMMGDYKEANYHALEYHTPSSLFSNVALAASYAGQFKYDEASKIARYIEKTFPDFLKSPRAHLETWNFPKEFVDKLLIGAKDAGINFSQTTAQEDQAD